MEVVDSDFGRYPRGRVATYRAYRIDDASRISETAIVFEAPDDVTATARARALLGDRDKFEIRGGRGKLRSLRLFPAKMRRPTDPLTLFRTATDAARSYRALHRSHGRANLSQVHDKSGRHSPPVRRLSR
jgi:hypothetical protein